MNRKMAICMRRFTYNYVTVYGGRYHARQSSRLYYCSFIQFTAQYLCNPAFLEPEGCQVNEIISDYCKI